MDNKLPERLTFNQFMPSYSSLQIFHGTLETTTGLHWHEFYEISFLLSGEGVNYLNGTEYPVRKGSIFLLTPADFHELVPENGKSLELFNVIFSDEVLDDELRQLLFNKNTPLMAIFDQDMYTAIEAEFRRIWQETNVVKPGVRKIVQGTLERILIELGRVFPYTSPTQGNRHQTYQPAIRRALIYMQHHFREELTLENAAKQARLAPNYFSECFRKAVGISFQHYLQELRILFARSLLKMSELSVTEICFASGFNNLSHFERVFKQKNGISPNAYRHKNKLNI